MKLLNELSEHLSGMNVEWYLCGGFAIDAYLGNITRKHKDVDITVSFDNIWCYKKDANFIKTEKTDGIFKYVSFTNREQTELDFIEVLFNKIENGVFHYQKNYNITLEKPKAFIKKGEISILAPEIVLLYKSQNSENSDYQHDFDMIINNLGKERLDWFINAMNIIYPKGHTWIK